MEENPLRFENPMSHTLQLKERKQLDITGVKQIESFDSTQFLLEVSQGWMNVEGNDLVLDKLDTDKGDVRIRGTIESISYVVHRKEEKESMMSRWFK
jgi:sporulation protein YabP